MPQKNFSNQTRMTQANNNKRNFNQSITNNKISKQDTSNNNVDSTESQRKTNKIKIVQINPKRILTGPRASVPSKLAKTSDSNCKITEKYSKEVLGIAQSDILSTADPNENIITTSTETLPVSSDSGNICNQGESSSTSVIKKSSFYTKEAHSFPKIISSFSVSNITDSTRENHNVRKVKVIQSVNQITRDYNNSKEIPIVLPITNNESNFKTELKKLNEQRDPQTIQVKIKKITCSVPSVMTLPKKVILINERDTFKVPIIPPPSFDSMTYSQDNAGIGNSTVITSSVITHSGISLAINEKRDFTDFSPLSNTVTIPKINVSDFGFAHKSNDNSTSVQGNIVETPDDPPTYTIIPCGEYTSTAMLSSELRAPQNVPVDYSSIGIKSKEQLGIEATSLNESSVLSIPIESETSSVLSEVRNTILPMRHIQIRINDYEADVSLDTSMNEENGVSIGGNDHDCIAKLPSIESAFSKVADSFRYGEEQTPSYATLK